MATLIETVYADRVYLRRWSSLLLLLYGLCFPASGTPFTCAGTLGGHCEITEELGDDLLSLAFWAVPGETLGSSAVASYDRTIYTAGPERSGFMEYEAFAHGGGSSGGSYSQVDLNEDILAESRFRINPAEVVQFLLGTPVNISARAGGTYACPEGFPCPYENTCPYEHCETGVSGIALTLQFFEAVPDPRFPDCPGCVVPGDPVRILYAAPAAIPEPSTWVLMASGLVLGGLRRLVGRR
jgi:hypothetical protein